MADRERPWSKFYWSDWESDKKLAQCSLAAQGLWMRLLCICAKSSPRGYVTVNGKPLDLASIAIAVSRPENEVEPLLRELSAWGVFSRTRSGAIYSRRMINDEKRSKAGRKAKQTAIKKATSRSHENIENKEQNSEGIRGPTREPARGPSPQRPETRDQNKESKQQASTPSSEVREAAGRSVEDEIFHRTGQAVLQAIGIDPTRTATDYGLVRQWLADGADPDTHILPTIEQVMTKQRQRNPTFLPRSLAYFTQAITEARTRTAGGNGHNGSAIDPAVIIDGQRMERGVPYLGIEPEPWSDETHAKMERFRTALRNCAIDPDKPKSQETADFEG